MGKLQLIPFDRTDDWDDIVKSFARYDTYYLNGYVSPFRFTGDGDPLLIYYTGDQMRLCYAVQLSDIAESVRFAGALKRGQYFDLTTPYGYGGPLNENYVEREIWDFFTLLNDYCTENGIISQFIRFHPLLGNETVFEGHCDLLRLKNTVFIDTTDRNAIDANMESTCRGKIRKAQKSGITVEIDNSVQARSEFIRLYSETMRRRDASHYYFFGRDFFDDFFHRMAGQYSLFSALMDGEIICSAIILHSNGTIHYHLSASDSRYMHLAPNNLLLYTAACWGADNGYKKFHLGGGVKSEDSLLVFKRSFNKRGLLDFYIGRNVFSREKFQELVRLRADSDPEFDPENDRMIQYRA